MKNCRKYHIIKIIVNIVKTTIHFLENLKLYFIKYLMFIIV